MTAATDDRDDSDLWPCGLVVMDESGRIQQINLTLRRWLGLDDAAPHKHRRFVDILSRAGRIYFETHLRPLLVMNGHFSEVSIELERPDGTRFGVFLNGRATLVDGRMITAHFCVFQNQQRQSFERELVAKRRESEEFRSLVRSSPHAIVSVDMNLIIRAWNPAAETLFGHTATEAIGERFDLLLIPPEELEQVADDLRQIASGEILRSETERFHKDGRRLQVEKSIAAITDNTQGYAGFVAVYSDISERKAADAQIQTLMHEVNHRAKNLLSVVQAIARQTGRRHEGADFISVFTKRLASLTSNQDILIRNHGENVDLETLARSQFSHLVDPTDPRVTISGPAVGLNENVSRAIGMAIFELVTNAAKYGALSLETGSVTLSWDVTTEPKPVIGISWIEADGPPVTAPTRKGFGFQVTGPILESFTSGQTTRDYAENGFRWTLSAPYHQVAQSKPLLDATTGS